MAKHLYEGLSNEGKRQADDVKGRSDIDNARALKEAAGKGQGDEVRMLLAAGVHPDAGMFTLTDPNLGWRKGLGELKLSDLKVRAREAGATTDAVDELDDAADPKGDAIDLIISPENPNSQIVGHLEDKFGPVTALWLAARNGYDDIVYLLAQSDANLNYKPQENGGGTPLENARRGKTEGHIKVVRLLVELGAEGATEDELMQSEKGWAEPEPEPE